MINKLLLIKYVVFGATGFIAFYFTEPLYLIPYTLLFITGLYFILKKNKKG